MSLGARSAYAARRAFSQFSQATANTPFLDTSKFSSKLEGHRALLGVLGAGTALAIAYGQVPMRCVPVPVFGGGWLVRLALACQLLSRKQSNPGVRLDAGRWHSLPSRSMRTWTSASAARLLSASSSGFTGTGCPRRARTSRPLVGSTRMANACMEGHGTEDRACMLRWCAWVLWSHQEHRVLASATHACMQQRTSTALATAGARSTASCADSRCGAAT